MNQPTRQRMTHQARRQQLIGVAWNLVREQGSDALTLGRVAEEASVSEHRHRRVGQRLGERQQNRIREQPRQ